MKPKIIVIIALICFLIFILPAADMGLEVTLKKLDSHNSIGKQWLIMIAVGHYREWPNLQNPVNDTKQIETVLKRKYYIDEIIKVYDQDATKRNITRLFLDLQDKAGIHDSILIYYAGHGYLDKNSNSGFWIPFDAGTDAIAQRNWLPNTQIRGYISQMKSMHICLIVDACFSGDILEISRGKPNLITNEYFRKAYKRTSRQVLTSGALEAVPDKSEFAFLLTQTLEKNTSPYIDPLMLFKEIRLGVRCTTPLLGNLKLTGHQDGASFLLFLKEPALQYVAHDHESSINTQKKIMSDDSNECTWENKEAPYNMIYVKGGKFKMGAQHGAIDEWPVHEVVINDFYIGRYEVTFHEYQMFC